MMVPQNCPYAALSRPFRALSRPSRIGTRNYDHVFVCKFCINGIQTFRQPFAALSPLQQKHVHICRCHSDTKSLAWVLEPLSYCIYSNLYSIQSDPNWLVVSTPLTNISYMEKMFQTTNQLQYCIAYTYHVALFFPCLGDQGAKEINKSMVSQAETVFEFVCRMTSSFVGATGPRFWKVKQVVLCGFNIVTQFNRLSIPIGSMYAIYGHIYHQYTPHVSIYTIHGSYG